MSKTLLDKIGEQMKDQASKNREVRQIIPASMFETKLQAPDMIQGNEQIRYSLNNWWVVIEGNKYIPFSERAKLYERALKYIPSSYKLWFNYLRESIEEIKLRNILSSRYKRINDSFERSLQYLSKMPRIWIMYAEFLGTQGLITKTRQTYDRALQNLPITQHDLIWDSYIEWVVTIESPETQRAVIQRYILLDANYQEDYVEVLIRNGENLKAATILQEILQDDGFVSQRDKSQFDFYIQLCDHMSSHASDMVGLDCEALIRDGLKQYSDEVGNLWVRLAQFYIRNGNFNRARDIFQEAIGKVMTSQDFGTVYSAYLKFEQQMVEAVSSEDVEEDEEALAALQIEIEAQIERLENLVNNRPMLLNLCHIRQNPNNVSHWLKRIEIYQEDPIKTVEIYLDATKTIDPEMVENGSFAEIWVKFAQLYSNNEDFESSNTIFNQATQIAFKSYDDFVTVWCCWVEMLLQNNFISDAFIVVKQALFRKPAIKREEKDNNIEEEESEAAAISLHNNATMWALYMDMEMNYGTLETCRQAYKRMVDMKVITPFILINFASYLERNHYFEESFKVYETGINIFPKPANSDIWTIYLKKFVERYGGDQLERSRDLFEKSLNNVPINKLRYAFLMYAEFEENYGLINHAFEIYDRMVVNMEENNQLQTYNLYIAKVAQYLGITQTRLIFENAIENLKQVQMIKLGMRYAQLQRKMGEIDRARAIYVHICQHADPRDDQFKLWQTWEDFEIHHGNVDTFQEYMRIKRSALTQFNLMVPDVDQIKEQVERGIL